MARSRSRSRSRSPPRARAEQPRPARVRKTFSGFSSGPPRAAGGFSDQAPAQLQPKKTTAEILEEYKQFNPKQSLTNHNKTERQLYVGNIPAEITTEELMDILNKALIDLGKPVGIFQGGNPIIGSWISGDGHYAFVDFRSADEATQGFVLQQVQIKGSYLKVGRPKNAQGIIPSMSQLLCGDPNFNPNNPSSGKQGAKATSSASLVQQALRQSKALVGGHQINFNQRLHITNFPMEHNEFIITKICQEFGPVDKVELIKDQHQNFTGGVYVDFESEYAAKEAFSKMMGLEVGKKFLYVKKMQAPTMEEEPIQAAQEEVFKQIIEDRATTCLIIKNVVNLAENHEAEDFKELEFDVQDEMMKYGNVIRTHVPRPPKYGDPYSQKGFGKVYVRFSNEKEAEKAKLMLFKRRFNDRAIEIMYYSEDKFIKNYFE